MFTKFSAKQQGMLLALIGYTCFAFADASAKWALQFVPNLQFAVIQASIASVFLILFSRFLGGLTYPQSTKHIIVTGIRIALNVVINLLLIYSFTQLALTSIYTMIFTIPFWAAILSIPFYGEKVGLHRWSAIVIGFAGVVIAMQPWQNEIDPNMLLVLFIAFLVASMFILTKSLQGQSAFSMAFYPIAGIAVIVLPFAFPVWEAIENPMVFIVMTGAGAFFASAQVFIAIAYQRGDAAVVAPMIYSEIIWAVLFGYLIFGDGVDLWMMAGCGVIIFSGLYLTYRERHQD